MNEEEKDDELMPDSEYAGKGAAYSDDEPPLLTKEEVGRALKPHDDTIRMLRREAAKYAAEDEETRRGRERRERSRRIISALSDGVRALGNMYFTTQYAPNMYDGSEGELSKVDKRIEEARAQRKAREDKLMSLNLKIGDVERERLGHLDRLVKAKAAERRSEEEHGWKRKRQPLIDAKAENDAEKSYFEKKIKEGEYNDLPRRLDDRHEESESRRRKNDRSGSSGGRGGSSRKYIDVVDKDGTTVRVYDEDLNDFYSQLPEEARNRLEEDVSFKGGVRNVSKEEKRQAVADHLKTQGNTFKRRERDGGKGAGYRERDGGKGAGYRERDGGKGAGH